jgi:hypothetical protein
MPYITNETGTGEGTWRLKERVTSDDMGSEFFCNHLVRRLRWAIADVVTPGSQPTAPADRGPRPSTIDAPSELS